MPIRVLGVGTLLLAQAVSLSRPPHVLSQEITAGVLIGHYQLDRIGTAGGGRERVWTVGPRVSIPAFGERAELAASLEYGVARNERQAPKLLALRFEFVHMARSQDTAAVRPTLVGGVSAVHFRNTLWYQTLVGPGGEITQSSLQFTAVGGLGFSIRLTPAIAISPRVEGLIPLVRTRADPAASVYLRWALNMMGRFD